MQAPRVSPGRFACELVVGSVLVLAGITVTGLGVAHWLLTILPPSYPCGETSQVHPSCRLADPGAVRIGYLLTTVAPAVSTLAGVLVGTWTFANRVQHFGRLCSLPQAVDGRSSLPKRDWPA